MATRQFANIVGVDVGDRNQLAILTDMVPAVRIVFGEIIRRYLLIILSICLLFSTASTAVAQKKRTTKPPAKPAPKTKAPTELEKLRDQYIAATKEVRISLDKLLPLYDKELQTAQEKAAKSKELETQGLISKKELADAERAVTEVKLKIDDIHKQMASADDQIAQVLVEIESEKQLAKLKKIPKGGMVMTTSFVRFNGAGAWSISLAGTVDAFFRQKFGHPLPIAVLGQGNIHNRWRLDHRNAMDLSLNPNGAEGQAVMDYLRSRGIPFSAFRQAIPGTATGPHIHVGLPSHRY
ncbi:MAG TPA: hypothetical protein VN643_16345 [Pyrinomonadaceae bacterium]|nr:hypothetical protein [Pyrinomonadaceae bacterium]